FVSNGPLLNFTVNGKGLGEEIVLPRAAGVGIEGSVRFDPERDQVERLELIENGEVARTWKAEGRAGAVACKRGKRAVPCSWLALRAGGKKSDEKLYPLTTEPSPAMAHTAAIYINVRNTQKLAEQRRAKMIAQKWKERLDALEKRLAETELPKLAGWPTTKD